MTSTKRREQAIRPGAAARMGNSAGWRRGGRQRLACELQAHGRPQVDIDAAHDRMQRSGMRLSAEIFRLAAEAMRSDRHAPMMGVIHALERAIEQHCMDVETAARVAGGGIAER